MYPISSSVTRTGIQGCSWGACTGAPGWLQLIHLLGAQLLWLALVLLSIECAAEQPAALERGRIRRQPAFFFPRAEEAGCRFFQQTTIVLPALHVGPGARPPGRPAIFRRKR